MTKKELLEELKDVPDDAVICDSDGEPVSVVNYCTEDDYCQPKEATIIEIA